MLILFMRLFLMYREGNNAGPNYQIRLKANTFIIVLLDKTQPSATLHSKW